MVRSSLYGFLALASSALAWKAGVPDSASVNHYINYTTVGGFFLQDDAATDPGSFDYANFNFGLINRTYPSDSGLPTTCATTQWQRFAFYVKSLNEQSGDDVAYKVFWFGRHGEGYHNAAESYYGTPAWNCYWSELDGNGTVSWADADLTANGLAQAYKANAFWKSRIDKQRIPTPESYYSSPLTRCLKTANITFANLTLPASKPFAPKVKEFFREGISIHTCDRRSNKTYIANLFKPSWTFEPDFAETDPLWSGVLGEDSASEDARSKIVMDEVFREDSATFVSVTSHSGQIASVLRTLRHRSFSLSTGQIIPVLVKAQKLYQAYPTAATLGWTSLATCTALPASSAASGCICGASATPTA